jgi:capsular polysaccharide biosynthesis protein
MEQLAPEEVVSLLQGTTVLIGTHGSGLAHLWFLPRTSSLIEIHPPGASEMFTPNSFANGAPWLVDYMVRTWTWHHLVVCVVW